MTNSISEDLRSRVLSAVDGGLSWRAAAERFGVARASAVRWVREWFVAYAQQVLAQTLRPGNIVILDNLTAHKTAAAREAIESAGGTAVVVEG